MKNHRSWIVSASLVTCFSFLSPMSAPAQAEEPYLYYFHRSEKVPLAIDEARLAVRSRVEPRAAERVLESLGRADLRHAATLGDDLVLFASREASGTPSIAEIAPQAASALGALVSPVFRFRDDLDLVLEPYLFAYFGEGEVPADLERESPLPVEVERDWRGKEGLARLVPQTRDALEILAFANELAAREDVDFAHPNFLGFGGPPSGQYIPSDPRSEHLSLRRWRRVSLHSCFPRILL